MVLPGNLAWLQADLGEVNGFLATMSPDSIAWHQFASRKKDLEAAIASFDSTEAAREAGEWNGEPGIESEVQVEGYLFLLPEGRRFDMTEDQAGRRLLYKGTVDREILREQAFAVGDIVGKRWQVLLRKSEVGQSYTLARLLQAA